MLTRRDTNLNRVKHGAIYSDRIVFEFAAPISSPREVWTIKIGPCATLTGMNPCAKYSYSSGF